MLPKSTLAGHARCCHPGSLSSNFCSRPSKPFGHTIKASLLCGPQVFSVLLPPQSSITRSGSQRIIFLGEFVSSEEQSWTLTSQFRGGVCACTRHNSGSRRTFENQLSLWALGIKLGFIGCGKSFDLLIHFASPTLSQPCVPSVFARYSRVTFHPSLPLLLDTI